MGYCIFQDDCAIHIDAANKAAALAAIKALDPPPDSYHSPGGKFSWVTTEVYKNASTLEEALEEWRWLATNNEAGDTMFRAIAPYISGLSGTGSRAQTAGRAA